MSGFVIGQKVQRYVRYQGWRDAEVVQVVPPHKKPIPLPTEYGGGFPRAHETYVLKEASGKTYWPNVKHIRGPEVKP